MTGNVCVCVCVCVCGGGGGGGGGVVCSMSFMKTYCISLWFLDKTRHLTTLSCGFGNTD